MPEQRLHETAGEMDHIGLQGISERVHLLNGAFEVQSAPGKGTTFTARFPIPKTLPQVLGETP